MNLRSFLRYTGACLLLLMSATIAVVAAAPNKPIEFSAKRINEPNKPASVLLSWMEARDGDEATHFDIYIAEGETENLDDFRLLATVDGVGRGTDGKPRFYTYSAEDLADGVYTFFIVARNDDGESPRTSIKVVHVEKPKAKLTFVSAPTKVGYVNQGYRYQAKATSNVGGTIRYSLVDAPEGMVIVEETGVIEWAPTEEGRYEITVKATVTLENGEVLETEQRFVIEVKAKKEDPKEEPKDGKCVIVKGSVVSDPQTNTQLKGVVVAWRTDVVNNNTDGKDRAQTIYKAEIERGMFEIKVPAGTYKFVVEGPDFESEWYENATSADEATAKSVECNSVLELRFTVASKPMPELVAVSGTVVDEESGAPIQGVVTFEAVGDKEKRIAQVVRAETNEEGKYEANLAKGVSYVASAKASNRSSVRYAVEYYSETADPQLATPIKLDDARDDINFTLAALPVYANSISGTLVNADGAAITGVISAYMLVDKEGKEKDNDDRPLHKKFVYSVETSADGSYSFSNLEPGTYILFAKPSARPNVPGWHVEGGTASREWKDASRIEVGETSSIDGATITLAIGEKELRGQGHVRGWVVHNRSQAVGKSGDGVQGAATVQGALILAIDERGTVIDWALTDEVGGYSLTTIPVGTITVLADRVGLRPAQSTVVVDGDARATREVNLGLNDVTSSIENPSVLSENGYNLWPNPAATSVTMQFPSHEGTATIAVIGTDGSTISTMVVEAGADLTRVVIPTETLATGRYMIRGTVGTRSFALPLSVIR